MARKRPKNYEVVLDPCEVVNPWSAHVIGVVTIRWQKQKFVISDDVTPNDRPYFYIQLYDSWDDSYDYFITRNCKTFYSINGDAYNSENDEHKGMPVIKELAGGFDLGLNPKYSKINAIIGILECIKLELYRRVAAPYEDVKAAENGDVPEYSI